MNRSILLFLLVLSSPLCLADIRDCISKSYPWLKAGLTPRSAMELAARKCQNVADTEVMIWLAGKHRSSLSRRSAMELAMDESGWGTYGKLSMIQFAWSKYKFHSYTPSSAASHAAAMIRHVPAWRGVTCLEEEYQNWFRELHRHSPAMDAAIQSCR